MAVAPWLQEPGDLDEAYGTRSRPVVEGGPKGRAVRPPQQPKFKERVAAIKPYRDIVEQVERNFHGKGGWRREVSERGHQANIVEKNRGRFKKPPQLTELDMLANSLATSRCHRCAKGTLINTSTWPDPDPKYPEVAFAGRSNVGKSSLLNNVSAFGTVAAVSNMPGKTKHVSWYRNRKVKLDVIDMPGYGHSDRARVFGPAALEFVRKRESLRCLYILIDARHGFKHTDHEWLEELGWKGPQKQVILTKCDLVPAKKLIQIASLARADLEQHRRVEHKLLLCSSAMGSGLHDIRADIVRRCCLESPRERDDFAEPAW